MPKRIPKKKDDKEMYNTIYIIVFFANIRSFFEDFSKNAVKHEILVGNTPFFQGPIFLPVTF